MNEPEILDSDIRALQQWLRTAWQQLGDPSLTAFARRELRNQMKQCSADLRAQLRANGGATGAAGPAAGHELHQARSANSGLVKQRSGADRGSPLGGQPRTHRSRHGADKAEQHHIRAVDEAHPGRADQRQVTDRVAEQGR